MWLLRQLLRLLQSFFFALIVVGTFGLLVDLYMKFVATICQGDSGCEFEAWISAWALFIATVLIHGWRSRDW